MLLFNIFILVLNYHKNLNRSFDTLNVLNLTHNFQLYKFPNGGIGREIFRKDMR